MLIAEKCTNKSSLPSLGEMKPKPFASLNHLTLPVAMTITPCLTQGNPLQVLLDTTEVLTTLYLAFFQKQTDCINFVCPENTCFRLYPSEGSAYHDFALAM
jgi:hypothetical protein